MITILVSVLVSYATTAVIYWYLHRANSTATQVVVDSAVAQIKEDAKDAVEAVKDRVS